MLLGQVDSTETVLNMHDVWIPVGGAILSVLVSGIVAWRISKTSEKKKDKSAIELGIRDMIGFAIKYPYLESEEYCKAWDSIASSAEDDLRYQNYCCFVFNMLSSLHGHCEGKDWKIRSMVFVDEIIKTHHSWWVVDPDNENYGLEFCNFVEKRWLEITAKEKDKNVKKSDSN